MLHAICAICGEDVHKLEGECKVAPTLTPLEYALTYAAMQVDFCDHFCCGMTDTTCKAKSIARSLLESEEFAIAWPKAQAKDGK